MVKFRAQAEAVLRNYPAFSLLHGGFFSNIKKLVGGHGPAGAVRMKKLKEAVKGKVQDSDYMQALAAAYIAILRNWKDQSKDQSTLLSQLRPILLAYYQITEQKVRARSPKVVDYAYPVGLNSVVCTRRDVREGLCRALEAEI